MRVPAALTALLVLGLAACVAPDPAPEPAPRVSDEALREYLLRTALEEVGGAAAGCGGSQLADIPCRLFDAHGVREVQCQTERALALAAAVCPAPPPSRIADLAMPPVYTPPIDVFVPHVPPPPPPPNTSEP